MRLASIGRSLVAAIIWAAIGYVIFEIATYHSYVQAFENTKNGEALNVVLRRFGAPSHIDGLHDVPGKEGHLVSGCGESCTLRLWYELRFMLGTHALTVDFDSRHKVINKYEMYSP